MAIELGFEEENRQLAALLRAMAHPKRLHILHDLCTGKKSYAALHTSVDLGKTALANHLTILLNSGLIAKEKRGSYLLSDDGKLLFNSVKDSFDKSKARSLASRQRIAAQYAKRGSSRMKRIKKLKYQPRWVSHLGAIEGCLKYAGHKISTAWLYGGTGHAFVMNIAPGVCPSGPTAWRTMMLFELAPNLGYAIDGIFAMRQQDGFKKKQEEAWDHIRKSIDMDIPCYGWELESPEFYVIQGYDAIGYWYSGPENLEGKGPRPWQEVGSTEIGVLELYSVNPGKEATPEKVLKDAFAKVLHMAANPNDIVFPQNRAGLLAYDLWISDVEKGTALPFGMAYNAAVWTECRNFAVDFLKEARKKARKELRNSLQEARDHYEIVAKSLSAISKLFPFPPVGGKELLGISLETQEAAELLKTARASEKKGLESINEIHKML